MCALGKNGQHQQQQGENATLIDFAVYYSLFQRASQWSRILDRQQPHSSNRPHNGGAHEAKCSKLICLMNWQKANTSTTNG